MNPPISTYGSEINWQQPLTQEDPVVPRRRRTKTPRKAVDWIPFKDYISNLLSKKWRLPSIRDHLEEKYGFDASIAQYNHEIAKWDTKRRNLKLRADQASFLSREIKIRRELKKKTAFRHHGGSEIPVGRVENYLKRKSRSLKAESISPASSAGISVYTPSSRQSSASVVYVLAEENGSRIEDTEASSTEVQQARPLSVERNSRLDARAETRRCATLGNPGSAISSSVAVAEADCEALETDYESAAEDIETSKARLNPPQNDLPLSVERNLDGYTSTSRDTSTRPEDVPRPADEAAVAYTMDTPPMVEISDRSPIPETVNDNDSISSPCSVSSSTVSRYMSAYVNFTPGVGGGGGSWGSSSPATTQSWRERRPEIGELFRTKFTMRRLGRLRLGDPPAGTNDRPIAMTAEFRGHENDCPCRLGDSSDAYPDDDSNYGP